MKKALKDSHNISRKRKPRPGSLLGDWKLRNKQRKEQIFDEPSVTGDFFFFHAELYVVLPCQFRNSVLEI